MNNLDYFQATAICKDISNYFDCNPSASVSLAIWGFFKQYKRRYFFDLTSIGICPYSAMRIAKSL